MCVCYMLYAVNGVLEYCIDVWCMRSVCMLLCAVGVFAVYMKYILSYSDMV